MFYEFLVDKGEVCLTKRYYRQSVFIDLLVQAAVHVAYGILLEPGQQTFMFVDDRSSSRNLLTIISAWIIF